MRKGTPKTAAHRRKISRALKRFYAKHERVVTPAMRRRISAAQRRLARQRGHNYYRDLGRKNARFGGLCPSCGVRPKERDGRGGYCTPCRARKHKEYRKHAKPSTAEERRRHNVRTMTHYYVRTGRIPREPCRGCGAKRAQAHHPDYGNARRVVWLCPPCHTALHRN